MLRLWARQVRRAAEQSEVRARSWPNPRARMGSWVRAGGRVRTAVDSAETIEAAVRGGVREVVIDVNVGLPRCGCPPADAGMLASLASDHGLSVRGVMGYEGHVMILEDAAERASQCRQSMELLAAAAPDGGGRLISAGGTGTYDFNSWATEIQAGSYALMDAQYGRQGKPFPQAVFVLASVVTRASA